jgi:hypothetical protein
VNLERRERREYSPPRIWSERPRRSHFAAVTDFTLMVSPLAVPVTLASSHASLLSLLSVP